jgi:iron complex outermembrane receptor protein
MGARSLPLAPKWQIFAGAIYKLPLEVKGDLRIGVDATYETSYYSDVFNYAQGKVPDQGYIDAFISYAPRQSVTIR